ncbi:hypothetical protein P152DRAFT_458626 [Eremomyces bilateralis CBS 781.70]|uniref:NADH dehydrogenase [ubiquinone] 1 alpha subcomplex subunit 1 n=1 Tax=Eremomyces bilateralis CBS 781.70 TaxID=1392243 RepID=A0A6G1G2A3_9PEZI|nr:uncharacterized protein P152DRAFT_458626 [Eremomyces bilateralis CBS 781.70]KAF1812235.1 hypothetical protein P152DRAFT_458626 [Eremomyces bilateralis CBS 781.70]
MAIPFEALLPYAVIVTFFGISGAGLLHVQRIQNGGKKGRRGVDRWDSVHLVMQRDRRLTGFLRGQTDKAAAPEGFEFNNAWRVEKRFS